MYFHAIMLPSSMLILPCNGGNQGSTRSHNPDARWHEWLAHKVMEFFVQVLIGLVGMV
jgi:hypothetical protein